MTTLAAVGLGIHVDALESYAERLRALLNTDPLTLLDERAAKARLEHGEGQPTAEQITDAARRMNAPEAEAGA